MLATSKGLAEQVEQVQLVQAELAERLGLRVLEILDDHVHVPHPVVNLSGIEGDL